MKILILAYLLQGSPVLKTLHFPVDRVLGFYQINRYYNNYPESFKCAIALKKPVKDRIIYESTETCAHLQYRYNKIVWGK
jgi:hypothetical protein